MATLTKISRADHKHTVKFHPGLAADDPAYEVLGPDGAGIDWAETMEEALELASDLTDASMDEAKEEARAEYEAELAEEMEEEREALAEELKDLIDGMDLKALKSLAKRIK